MLLGPAVIQRLEADAAVVSIVAGRIHWLVRPQGRAGDLPAIVLQIISEERTQHLKGFDDMVTARVQVACLADKYSVSRQLAEAATAALIGVATVLDPSGDVAFWRGAVEGPTDLGNQEETRFVHRAVVDVILRYHCAA